MHRLKIIVLFLLICFSSFCEEKFVISINRPEGDSYSIWVKLVYEEIFERLGIELELKYLPMKRSSVQADEGRVDAESGRIYNYGEFFPNMVRVEEWIFPMVVNAYSDDKKDENSLSGWKSLKKVHRRIEYPRGMKIAEINLEKAVNKKYLNPVRETFTGLSKLVNGRSDLYIDDMNGVDSILANPKYKLNKKVYVAGKMDEVKLYMFIHRKNEEILPELNRVIREVRENGIIDELRKKAFESK